MKGRNTSSDSAPSARAHMDAQREEVRASGVAVHSDDAAVRLWYRERLAPVLREGAETWRHRPVVTLHVFPERPSDGC